MSNAMPLLILVLLGGVALVGVLFLLSVAWLNHLRPAGRRPGAGLRRDPPDEPGERWAVVRTYNTAESAHVDRAMLEGSGIPTYLDNEFTVATDWAWGVAVGVDLLVPDSRRQEAASLVYGTPPKNADAPVRPRKDAAGSDAHERRCSRCGSAEVYRVRTGRGWAMLTILVLWFPVAGLRRWRCDDCGVRVAG